MTDPLAWADLGRWLLKLGQVLPNRVLRWAWSESKLMDQVRVVTAAEPPPHFFVRIDRENPELTHLRFHVFNLSPFKLAIVAAQGTVVLEDRELFRHEQRFVTEVPLPPFESASFEIRHALTEPQAQRLRGYSATSARFRMNGGAYLRTPFGECLKPVSCDLDARIVR